MSQTAFKLRDPPLPQFADGGLPTPIDPGAEPAGPRGTLEWLISYIERHPACTLAGGEGKQLIDEINRLNLVITEIQFEHK